MGFVVLRAFLQKACGEGALRFYGVIIQGGLRLQERKRKMGVAKCFNFQIQEVKKSKQLLGLFFFISPVIKLG